MAKITPQLNHIDGALKQDANIVELPYIDLPTTTGGAGYTDIVNRAKVADFSNDLMPRLGIERIETGNTINIVDGELGPNDERIYCIPNDVYNRIRLGGKVSGEPVLARGKEIFISDDGFLEITFFGTGLNILCDSRVGSPATIDVFVDGVAISDVNFGGNSEILRNRNYAANTVFNAATGLVLGLHTIKIMLDAASTEHIGLHGLEILNEDADLQISPGNAYAGGKQLRSTVTTAVSYDDSVDAYASETQDGGTTITDATRGGCVIAYLDKDGAFQKIVNYTDSTQGNLGATDHSNEQLLRRIHFKEFGAGRTDDFSTIDAVDTNRAFTLDDGTTTLVGNQVRTQDNGSSFGPGASAGDFLIITFVGTGLDIFRTDFGTGGSDTYTVYVDGTDIGDLDTAGLQKDRTTTLVSGLPYGTHTVKIETIAASTFSPAVYDFLIYGPKVPTLPDGAVKLAEYYLMADFIANTTAGLETIATGTLRKDCTKEWVYIDGADTWSNVPLDVINHVGGFHVETNAAAATGSDADITFFGTGLELRFRTDTNRTAIVTTSIKAHTHGDGTLVTWSTATGGGGMDAATLTAVSTARSNTVVYGGATDSAATGEFSQNAASQPGAGFSVNGLPLGLWTVRFAQSDGSGKKLIIATADIVTPIHVPQTDKLLSDTPYIGSNAIKSCRDFGHSAPEEICGHKKFKDTLLFEGGVDLGPNKTKWKTKNFANNGVQVDQDVFVYSNLKYGQTYRFSFTATIQGFNNIDWHEEFRLRSAVSSGGSIYGPADGSLYQLNNQGDPANNYHSISDSVIFTAVSSIAAFYHNTAGDDTSLKIRSQLEELPNHIETKEWD